MFRAHSAHHQEVNDVKCTYAASGIVTLCKWLSCATAKERLNELNNKMVPALRGCSLLFPLLKIFFFACVHFFVVLRGCGFLTTFSNRTKILSSNTRVFMRWQALIMLINSRTCMNFPHSKPVPMRPHDWSQIYPIYTILFISVIFSPISTDISNRFLPLNFSDWTSAWNAYLPVPYDEAIRSRYTDR